MMLYRHGKEVKEMGKQKKSGKLESHIEKILLLTATIELIKACIELIKELI